VSAIGQRAVKVNDHIHAPATKVWTSRCGRHDAEPHAVGRLAVGDEPALLDGVPDGGVTGVVVQSEALGNVVNGNPMASVTAPPTCSSSAGRIFGIPGVPGDVADSLERKVAKHASDLGRGRSRIIGLQ
jgi:hypothetical protein